MSDLLDPFGNAKAYEDGFRDGLKDARADLQLANKALAAQLAEQAKQLEAVRADLARYAEQLPRHEERIAAKAEADAVERIAVWLERVAVHFGSHAPGEVGRMMAFARGAVERTAAEVRAGAWKATK